MSIALIGGMARLERHYRSEAKKFGIKLRIFNTGKAGMARKLARVDAVLIFTNKVSHQARNQALSAAQKKGIPALMHHSCGLCTLRDCFSCLEGGLQDRPRQRPAP